MQAWGGIRDAMVFTVIPPAVQELGNATGFDFELEDQAGLGQAALDAAKGQLLGMAAKDPRLVAVRPNGPAGRAGAEAERRSAARRRPRPLARRRERHAVDRHRLGLCERLHRPGTSEARLPAGRRAFREAPADIGGWYVRGSGGAMAPFAAFSNTSWVNGPSKLERYNGLPSAEIQGAPAPGQSTGAAIQAMEELAHKLPRGIGFEWTGLSYEEQQAGSQAPVLYGLSVLVVFLCLAALYESWSVPLAVLLVFPLGIVGALAAATLRGLSNDVYLQVGLLTTMGLSAKNAILIVEFAEGAERQGKSARDAALEAARLRLRPILMTSFAFIAGVFPLAIANGAGSGSQNDIGTGVIGGMLTATVLGVLFVPLFFTLVRRFLGGRTPPKSRPADQINDANAGAR